MAYTNQGIYPIQAKERRLPPRVTMIGGGGNPLG